MSDQPKPTASTPPLVFISYSHKDEEWRNRLHILLKPAVQTGRISLWDDKSIEGGEGWQIEIDKAIAQARVAVLLVSPDYLASDWVIEKEAPQLVALSEKHGLILFPILLRPCY